MKNISSLKETKSTKWNHTREKEFRLPCQSLPIYGTERCQDFLRALMLRYICPDLSARESAHMRTSNRKRTLTSASTTECIPSHHVVDRKLFRGTDSLGNTVEYNRLNVLKSGRFSLHWRLLWQWVKNQPKIVYTDDREYESIAVTARWYSPAARTWQS